MSQRLGARLAAQVAEYPVTAPSAGRARTAAGDSCTVAETGLMVEVLAGTPRHAVITVTRLR
ncbi:MULTISPECIES: hypothetical protein [unclassified Streptomyces]|uniref:hypothetical protein n=1 Tax=unclassified Streptomyces TaxID=2593676 RepID=UPI003323EC6F